MIRIERGAEVSPGVFAYRVPSLGIEGKSRQPLLDACRQIKRILGPTGQRAGLFREGRSTPKILAAPSIRALRQVHGIRSVTDRAPAGLFHRQHRAGAGIGTRPRRKVAKPRARQTRSKQPAPELDFVAIDNDFLLMAAD